MKLPHRLYVRWRAWDYWASTRTEEDIEEIRRLWDERLRLLIVGTFWLCGIMMVAGFTWQLLRRYFFHG